MDLSVKFVWTVDEADQFKVREALVESQAGRISWRTSLRHFEPVHLLTRIFRLLPDKLATAKAICVEGLPDPADDGSFLIRLVLQLLEVC